MKLGIENKRTVWMLGVLALLAAYAIYDNFIAGPPSAPQPATAVRPNSDLENATGPISAPSAKSTAASPSAPRRPLRNRNSKGEDFHPVLRTKNARPGEQQINIADIDPEIHLELLAKVQNMKLEGGQRNLFQFGAPPAAEVKLPAGEEPKIAMGKPYVFPKPDPPKVEPPPPPAPPPPAPPTFKYYGLATKRINNKKTAFFLDGEDIIFATEGMTVKTKWRVVRIAAESVMLEDTTTKKQQPLALSEEAGGNS